MKEKLKTGLLALLVATSLLQTYMLAFNRPNLLPANPAEYVTTDLRGEQRDLSQLIFPRDIVIHFGEQSHTMLYPNDTFYSMILERLEDKKIHLLREIHVPKVELERMRQETRGIEIRYQTGLPYFMFPELFMIEPESLPEETRINTFWLFAEPLEEKVSLWLLTDQGVLQVDRFELSLKELEQFIQFGEHLHPPFRLLNGEIYIPEQPLEMMPKIRLDFELFTSEQLRNSLFVDPSISRSMLQQDGTEIITDGKRGLHIDHKHNWINYSDPVAPMESEDDLEMQIYSAIQFINQHGGWNGQYVLSRLPRGFMQQIRFLQYYESLPIIATNEMRYGYIEVTMRQRMATGYERSLLNIDFDKAEKTLFTLDGGDALEAKLHQYGLERIVSIFPAYEPRMVEDGIELWPRWAIELPGERYEFLK